MPCLLACGASFGTRLDQQQKLKVFPVPFWRVAKRAWAGVSNKKYQVLLLKETDENSGNAEPLCVRAKHEFMPLRETKDDNNNNNRPVSTACLQWENADGSKRFLCALRPEVKVKVEGKTDRRRTCLFAAKARCCYVQYEYHIDEMRNKAFCSDREPPWTAMPRRPYTQGIVLPATYL